MLKVDLTKNLNSCQSLVRVHNNRPVYITHSSGTIINISIHDDYYLGELAKFKQAKKDNHPDNGGIKSKFIEICRSEKRFLSRELNWYKDLNLDPPHYQSPVIKVGSADEARFLDLVISRPSITFKESCKILKLGYWKAKKILDSLLSQKLVTVQSFYGRNKTRTEIYFKGT